MRSTEEWTNKAVHGGDGVASDAATSRSNGTLHRLGPLDREMLAEITPPRPGFDDGDEKEDVDGVITVRAGRVFVVAPKGRGRYPTIRPSKHVRISVGGRVIDGPEVVTDADEIRVEPVDEPPVMSIQVDVSDDEMEAYVAIHRKPGHRYRVPDQAGEGELTVRAVPAEEVAPEKLTLADVRRVLAERGVVHGLRPEALERIVARGAEPGVLGESVLVAAGDPAEPTVHERVELLFDVAAWVRRDADEHQMDLLGLKQLTTVQPGDVLAVVHPGKPGRPGRTVTGKTIAVGKMRKARLLAGEGTQWSADRRRLFARRGGRPMRRGHVVCVHPKHTVLGDLDAKTGHVEFHGDVEILGGVGDSVRVRADGAVTVGGNVSNATVEAGESVYVGRGIAKSLVVAGLRVSRLLDRLALLRPLAEDFDLFLKAMEQVMSHPKWREPVEPPLTVGQLVQRLLETKYGRISDNVEKLQGLVRDSARDSDPGVDLERKFAGFVQALYRLMTRLGPLSLESVDELYRLQREFEQFIDMFQAEYDHSAGFDVMTGHIHNADVRASGRIVLGNGGCLYARLWAGRGLEMMAGAFRGHSVTVHAGDVLLREAGNRLGGQVHVHIVTEGVFRAGVVHPGVHLTIGNQRHIFYNGARNVEARLVKGELQIISAAGMLGASVANSMSV